MLRVLRLSGLSVFVLVLVLAVAAPAQAFPEWEQKPPPGWGPVVAQSAAISAPSIKFVIDSKNNHCSLKGGAKVENTGGHGYLFTEGVNGGCTGPTGNSECTPASSLQFFFKSWEAELVGAVFALSTAPTEVEVNCAAGTPGPAIGIYKGSLEPQVKPNVLRFFGTASGTLSLFPHTLDIVGKIKLVPVGGPATKLRG